jgi:predicted hotdog family 3-hydroxylacyl-ACP dehydratase
MAQAAAAQHGYNLAKDNKHEEKGFIVGIRRFKITGEASVNDKLSVSVKLGPEIESLSVVYGTVTCRSNQIASIELTVWHG